MQYSDRLLLYMFTNAIKNVPGSDKNDGKGLRLLFFGLAFCLLLLLFTGSETVKVVLRKKMGAGEISYLRVFLSSLAFTTIGFLLFYNAKELSDASFITFSSEEISLKGGIIQATGIFFILFAIIVFIKGFASKILAPKYNIPSMYPGDSAIFNTLEKRGYKKSTIRNFFEPLLFLIVGIISVFLNPFFALPIIICAVSYWLVLIAEYMTGLEAERINSVTAINNKSTTPIIY